MSGDTRLDQLPADFVTNIVKSLHNSAPFPRLVAEAPPSLSAFPTATATTTPSVAHNSNKNESNKNNDQGNSLDLTGIRRVEAMYGDVKRIVHRDGLTPLSVHIVADLCIEMSRYNVDTTTVVASLLAS